MKKKNIKIIIILCVLILLLVSGCSSDNGKYIQTIDPRRNFEGIGVITFPTSFNGTFRIMDFYPIYQIDKKGLLKENFIDSLNIDVRNCIVIRGRNDTDLWNSLRQEKSIEIGEYGYGLALIYINFKYLSTDKHPDPPYGSSITISNKYYDTEMYNSGHQDIKIIDYKIIRGLKE